MTAAKLISAIIIIIIAFVNLNLLISLQDLEHFSVEATFFPPQWKQRGVCVQVGRLSAWVCCQSSFHHLVSYYIPEKRSQHQPVNFRDLHPTVMWPVLQKGNCNRLTFGGENVVWLEFIPPTVVLESFTVFPKHLRATCSQSQFA